MVSKANATPESFTVNGARFYCDTKISVIVRLFLTVRSFFTRLINSLRKRAWNTQQLSSYRYSTCSSSFVRGSTTNENSHICISFYRNSRESTFSVCTFQAARFIFHIITVDYRQMVRSVRRSNSNARRFPVTNSLKLFLSKIPFRRWIIDTEIYNWQKKRVKLKIDSPVSAYTWFHLCHCSFSSFFFFFSPAANHWRSLCADSESCTRSIT